jgi:hypothetical protein
MEMATKGIFYRGWLSDFGFLVPSSWKLASRLQIVLRNVQKSQRADRLAFLLRSCDASRHDLKKSRLNCSLDVDPRH